MIPVLLALGLPAAFGFLLCRRAWPDRVRGAAGTVCQAALGTGLGLGVASVLYFAALLAGGSPGAWYAWAEGGAFALGAAALAPFAFRPGGAPAPPGPAEHRATLRAAAAGAAVLAAVFVLAYALNYFALPHGYNDSVMFWNLRARFLFRGGDHWRDAFGPMFIAPDYPLLLPATVARCWTYLGSEATLAPGAVALTFALAAVGVLASAVAVLRGATQGLLAGAVLLGTAYFLETAGMQIADVPAGYYFLAAAALLAVRDRADRGWGLSALAGVTVGFAAWTKNEGQLFALALVGTRVARAVGGGNRAARVREAGTFLLGLALVAPVLVTFKAAVAPPGGFLATQNANSETTTRNLHPGGLPPAVAADEAARQAVSPLDRVQDPDRYLLIAEWYASGLLGIGPGLPLLLAVYAGLLGPAPADRRAGAGPFAAVVGLVLAGYAAVYLVTPHDLDWRLDTSFDRLRIHVWPLALFAFFLWVATPAESRARADGPPEPGAAPAREAPFGEK